MPLAALPGGSRPSGVDGKVKSKQMQPPSAKKNGKRDGDNHGDDDEEEETTTDDSSGEDDALEMDGQELWTQTYCATCDCLIEPGEGIAKADDGPDSAPLATHSTLKSRSGTIKARTASTSDRPYQANENDKATATKESPAANKPGASNLKRTHSAGRLHARAGAGPLGPHKRTGSAGSRLNALSELRPTTKLHDDKAKTKPPAHDSGVGKGRKSPATSRPNSAASNRTHSNSSGPSSYKSNEATIGNHNNNNGSSQRSKGRGFLGGLTPAALKQQEAELAAKRKAPTPLYCSERCRLIDERRSSGLGELTKYLSQPLVSPAPVAWVPQPNLAWGPSPNWPRTTSTSSMPLPVVPGTPESECMCPECMDKVAEAGSAGGATIPSGASDTATESSSGFVYGRGPVSQKPRTASGRLITPHNLYAPGSGTDGYFPPQAAKQGSTSSPRVRPTESAYPMEAVRESVLPPRSSSAASGGKSSNAGTDGSAISSESGSSLWEPRIRRRPDSSGKSTSSSTTAHRLGSSTTNSVLQEANSGLTTSTVTPAISPRHSMISSPLISSHGTARQAHRLSVPVFAPVPKNIELEGPQRGGVSPSSHLSRPLSSSMKAAPSLATSPLNLLHRSSHHHAAPSIDLVSEHVGSPSTRGSLLSRSLASEHTLMGVSGITLHNHQNQDPAIPAIHEDPPSSSSDGCTVHTAPAQDVSRTIVRDPTAMRPSASTHSDYGTARSATDEELSLAVGSLRLAQSRAGGSLATMPRRMTDLHDKRPDVRRLSLFGSISQSERRDSNALSIASSGSGSTTSGWLRSLSSVWLNWRNSASATPARGDSSDVFASMEDSVEWPNHSILGSRRESDASRGSGGQQQQKRPALVTEPGFSGGELSTSPARVTRSSMSLSPRPASRDRSAGITPTQSLVAKPTIRRGSVPAFVREIGQGGIPGDASDGKFDGTANSMSRDKTPEGPAEHLARARADSLTTLTEEERRRRRQEKKEAKHRRSRDIAVLPPLLAPASRSGSSTNLYGQFGPIPRSARTYSNGRAWTVNNTPQMFVGSAGSSHHQPSTANLGEVPPSPTALRSPYQSSFALAQDAARATMSPSRPNSAAGYHAGTSPRVKGLGWGAVTSMAPITTNPPTSAGPHAIHFPHHHHHHHSHLHQQHQHALQPHGHSQSVSYGHAAALAARHVHAQVQAHHDNSSRHHHSSHHHSHHHHHHHHHHSHQHGHQPHQVVAQLPMASPIVNLGIPPNAHGQPALGRHSTMPVTLHRSPTPSVPEDGGEMSSQDLTSGDFISRPNSAMATQQGRQHRSSMMPPPRSRSSLGMHGSGVKPSTSIHEPSASTAGSDTDYTHCTTQRMPPEEPERKWSYDQLSGLKTYPILQLPDRETHDVYDPAWGLDAGGLAKHMGRPHEATPRQDPTSPKSNASARAEASSNVQKGFQPHRKKLFYFDA